MLFRRAIERTELVVRCKIAEIARRVNLPALRLIKLSDPTVYGLPSLVAIPFTLENLVDIKTPLLIT